MNSIISQTMDKISAYLKANRKYSELNNELRNSATSFILLYAPDYPNIGDAAIAIAEKAFLKDYFKGCSVHEIPFKDLSVGRIELLPIARKLKRYPLLITGGGFLGTIWFDTAEKPIRRLLSVLERNIPLLILPQTMYYNNDETGRSELKNASKLYRKHPNVVICMREKFSFSLAKKCFKKVYLFPDMVLYLNVHWKYNKQIIRSGAALCLRDDIESTMNSKERIYIDSIIRSHFADNVRALDMLNKTDVQHKMRDQIVENQMNKFREAEIVITDRLHGMLFAAVTETPCVVIASKSYKVKGCYEWIKHLEYIKLIDRVSEFENACEKVLHVQNRKYDMSPYLTFYDDLAGLISTTFEIDVREKKLT